MRILTGLRSAATPGSVVSDNPLLGKPAASSEIAVIRTFSCRLSTSSWGVLSGETLISGGDRGLKFYVEFMERIMAVSTAFAIEIFSKALSFLR